MNASCVTLFFTLPLRALSTATPLKKRLVMDDPRLDFRFFMMRTKVK